MRRRLVYLIAWAVATAVTVGIAWLGIRSVLVAASPRRVSPLSAADLRDAAPKVIPTPVPAPSPTTASPVPAETSPARSAPAGSDTWSPVPDGKGGTAFRRTFRTAGGEVVVLSAKGDVRIEASRPRPEFAVNVSRQSADSVIVSFFGPRKSSRVWARWNNGPYAEVTEVTGY